MALENTGKAYPQSIRITKKKDGAVESNATHPILGAFGSYPAISPTDWSLQSEAQAAQRIADFEQHLQPQYPGLNFQLARQNQAIVTDHDRCPPPGTKKKYTLSLATESQNLGKVDGGGTFEEGTSVSAIASVINPQLYQFNGWYNDSNVLVSSASTYTFTLTGNLTLTARFKLIKESVTIGINPYVIDTRESHEIYMRAYASKPVASAISISGKCKYWDGKTPNGQSDISPSFSIIINTGEQEGQSSSSIVSYFIAEPNTDKICLYDVTSDTPSDSTYTYYYSYSSCSAYE